MKTLIRPARASDKAPLMSFIKDIWNGHDYIPEVWDDWIRDRSAKMFVIEADGRQVGMNRVRFLQDGSAWFEGVRIHPDFRGKGLASLLGGNSMKIAAARGVKVYRLTSNSRNRAAHRQVARMRFSELARYSIYSPTGGVRLHQQTGVRRAGPEDLRFVNRTMRRSKEFQMGGGVMWDSFTAWSLTPEVIERQVRNGSVFVSDEAVGIVGPGREGNEVWSQICFLCGEPKAAVQIAKHAFGAIGKADWKLAYLTQGTPLVGAFRSAGFKRSFSMVLFERRANG